MKDLGITKGKWVGVDYAGCYSLQIAPFYGDKDLLDGDKTAEAEANMQLCCDAGNTTQKCGLLPSELLKQRDELKQKLSEIFAICEDGQELNISNYNHDDVSALNQTYVEIYLAVEAAIKSTEQ